VVVYGKPDCSLCDKAHVILERLRGTFGYRIECVDITQDPALFARYREAIPVILVNGTEIARLRVTLSGVRDALSAVLHP
jgi:glutaredoxin